MRVEEEDRYGRSLHAARSGTGGTADQHKDNAEELAAVGKLGVVRGVESGCSGSDRLKKRGQDPFLEGKTRVFNDEKTNGRKEDQDQRGHKNHLSLQTIFVEPELVPADVFPGPETEAAQDDQRHYDQVYRNASDVTCQGRKRLFFSHKIKARIAESGYRMKQGI